MPYLFWAIYPVLLGLGGGGWGALLFISTHVPNDSVKWSVKVLVRLADVQTNLDYHCLYICLL